jgi:hypothetical protein
MAVITYSAAIKQALTAELEKEIDRQVEGAIEKVKAASPLAPELALEDLYA